MDVSPAPRANQGRAHSSRIGRATRLASAIGAIFTLWLTLSASAFASSSITNFAGTGAAGAPTAGAASSSDLNGPQQVTIDKWGNVYIADTSGQRIEKITPDGTLSIIAGNGSRGASTPGPATSSDLCDPQGLAVDASGDVYIADTNNDQIDKVTPAGTLSVVAGNGTPGCSVWGQPGATTNGPALQTPLGDPMGMAIDPTTGDLIVADTLDHTISRITANGNLTVIAGTGTAGPAVAGPALQSPINDPEAVAVAPDGDVLVADCNGNEVEKITPSGTLSIVAGDGTAGPATAGPAAQSEVNGPMGVWGDAAGDIYIADTGNNEIEKVSPSGILSIIAGNGSQAAPTYGVDPLSSPLDAPIGVAADESGAFYVVDWSSNTVERVGPAVPGAPGQPNAVAGDTSATLTFMPPADHGTSPLTGYQLSLDGGSTWHTVTPTTNSDGTLSLSLTGLIDGTGYPVQLRAENTSGAGAATLSVTVTPQAPAPTTTSSTTTTTTTSTTPTTTTPTTTSTSTTSTTPTSTTPTSTTPAPAPAAGVSLPPATVQHGIALAQSGALSLPLVCPTTANGCDADGTLTIKDLSAAKQSHGVGAGSTSAQVIARFKGVQIASGHSKLVSIHLTAAALSELQARGVHRVLVTLTVDDHLDGGSPVWTVQHVWMNVPSRLAVCVAATGSLTGSDLGPLSLGESRSTARQDLPVYHRVANGFDNFCLSGGWGIRVAYATRANASVDTALIGHIVLALTANHHYNLDGVLPGMSVAAAAAKIELGPVMTIGRNDWYLIHEHGVTGVLKVRDGKVAEVGIASGALTRSQARAEALMHSID